MTKDIEVKLLINEVYQIVRDIERSQEFEELKQSFPELGGRTVFDTITSIPEISLFEFSLLFSKRKSLVKLYKNTLEKYKDISVIDFIGLKNNQDLFNVKNIYHNHLTEEEMNDFIDSFENKSSLILNIYKDKIKDFDIYISKNQNSAVEMVNSDFNMVIKYNSNKNNLEADIFHEIGHLLEVSNQNINKICMNFYLKRVDLNKLVSFNQFCDKNGIEEFMNPDFQIPECNFVTPYVGKRYLIKDDVFYTEVLSVGMQSLVLDHLNFLFKDPEHFSLVYNVLKGNFNG